MTDAAAGLPPIHVVAEAGSTNADVHRLAGADPAAWPHLAGLLARRQTSGRGRSGRTWTTDGTALTFSVVLRPGIDRAGWTWLPMLAGVATVDALADLGADAAVPMGLKWPNDVVHLGGSAEVPGWGRMRKMGGILSEVLGDGDGVVVGIGVNLTAAELPVPWAGAAQEVGITAAPIALARSIRTHLDALIRRAEAGEGARELVAPRCLSLGQWLRVELPGGEEILGRAVALADDGALLVRSDGVEHVVHAGDVRHVRAGG